VKKVERRRVIIADDEAIILQDLREMLTNLGYLVVGAVGDGLSAVNLARKLTPDLVIMDIRMPDMDGIDAAKILTQEGICPVLLLTAYSQRDLVERAAEAGVSGYVIKPFDEANLLPAMEVVLARFREYQEISKEAARLEERLATRVAVDRAKGILMDSRGMTEQEAFRNIQRLSMNNRKSMREVAEAIIVAHQISQP
jgi:response regulator NasT